jgi:hypothetical protein
MLARPPTDSNASTYKRYDHDIPDVENFAYRDQGPSSRRFGVDCMEGDPGCRGIGVVQFSHDKLVQKAYVEQTSLGWNLLFRGFWTISWRTAQDQFFTQNTNLVGPRNTGAQWASQAQGWAFDMFDLTWGLRNASEHGADPETQRMIRPAKCERAIRRLFHESAPLPDYDRYPFQEPMEDVLSKTVCVQERWVNLAEAFLPAALRRLRKLTQTGQRSIRHFFARRPNP